VLRLQLHLRPSAPTAEQAQRLNCWCWAVFADPIGFIRRSTRPGYPQPSIAQGCRDLLQLIKPHRPPLALECVGIRSHAARKARVERCRQVVEQLDLRAAGRGNLSGLGDCRRSPRRGP